MSLEGVFNFLSLFLDADGCNHRKHFLSFFHAALAHEETRGFRELPGGDTVEECRDSFDPEHHLPGFNAHNQVACGTRNADDDVVRKQRHEDTDNDGELLHGS